MLQRLKKITTSKQEVKPLHFGWLQVDLNFVLQNLLHKEKINFDFVRSIPTVTLLVTYFDVGK